MTKKIIIGLVLVFLAIQFYRPAKNISTEIPATDFLLAQSTDTSIALTMKASCYDCHSNNTKYPWYSEVAPISWWIANHVNEGKDELNLSLWSTFSDKKRDHKLEEMIELIEKKEMPLDSYLPMHPEAELSEEQRQDLITYFKEIRSQINFVKKK